MENDRNKEEELQRLAEQQSMSGTDKDSRAYKIVFEALHSDTDFQLSSRFADQVLGRLQEQSDAREYVWFGLGIVLLLAAAVVAGVLTDFKPDMGFLKGMSRYFNLFIFGGLFILAIQWLDRKFVRKLTAH